MSSRPARFNATILVGKGTGGGRLFVASLFGFYHGEWTARALSVNGHAVNPAAAVGVTPSCSTFAYRAVAVRRIPSGRRVIPPCNKTNNWERRKRAGRAGPSTLE